MDGWMDVNYTVNRRAQSNSIKVDKHNHTHPSIRNTYVPSIKLPVRAVEREREDRFSSYSRVLLGGSDEEGQMGWGRWMM